MVLPELSLLRSGQSCWLTLNVIVSDAEAASDAMERARRRLEVLREAPLGPLDPASTGGVRIDAPRPPDHYEQAVAAGVERIAAGELEKLVLAREVTVTSPAAHDAGPILGALRQLFPSCFCFCVGTPEAAFIGASPELLIRRRGAACRDRGAGRFHQAQRRPRCGRSPRRADAAQRQDREEHGSSRAGSALALRPHSVWVRRPRRIPRSPASQNIQHLATPIQAQLADSRSAIELAGLLHPTPAVGGEPARPRLR